MTKVLYWLGYIVVLFSRHYGCDRTGSRLVRFARFCDLVQCDRRVCLG